MVLPRRGPSWSVSLLLGLAACHRGPLPALTPAPAVLARIRHLRINVPKAACPGSAFAASYDGQLDDGSFLPHRLPPELLTLASPDATPLVTGDWTPSADPLASLPRGFPIVATLRTDTTVADTVVVAPEYSCLPRGLRFEGPEGQPGARGGDGPPITVHVGFVRTPYFPTLVVAAIQVADAAPFYLVADAAKVMPASWLRIESVGGRGGWGVPGSPGRNGAPGADGCPGQPGEHGEVGGPGGPGGQGGRGGPITIVGPSDWPLFAVLIDARSVGGPGGAGGGGGAGGEGGKGGVHFQAAHAVCVDGAVGPPGRRGTAGRDGPQGPAGPHLEVATVDPRDVFGADAPAILRSLVTTSGGAPR